MKHHAFSPPSILLFAILASCFCGCDFDKKEFIDVGKSTFESFYNGKRIADSTIDWNTVRINDDEVGRIYMQLNTDFEKAEFRRGTVSRLRSICAQKGWNPQNVRNWRIKDRGVESASVVGDGPGGSITMSMRKFGAEKRIGAIQIR